MKKIYIFSLIFLFVLSLSSCNLVTSGIETTTISNETTITSLDTTNETTLAELPTTEELTTITTTQSTVTTTDTQTTTENTNEPFVPNGYNLLQDELDYIGIPSEGDVKVLVFAVDFQDAPKENSGVTLADIDLAFNGESNELDFESLRSFYQKSSYGKLNISADIYGYYRADYTAAYYEEEYNKYWAVDPFTGDWLYPDAEEAESSLIIEVLEYYDSLIDYSDYDANHDGYIDGIYMIYTHDVSYSFGSDMWWAYQSYFAYENMKYDNVEANYYTWAGTDFFLEGDDNINARTIIHETGHMLGLDDYYDYDSTDMYGNSGGLGGADMMDSALGDHGPLSKMLLGWIKPLVVEESMTVDITPYIQNGDVILLIRDWHNTIFDEYLLISYYTPNGLYEEDKYDLFYTSGIVIYHVSAKITTGSDSEAYYSIFDYNNTDTEHKLVSIIEADMNDFIDTHGIAQDTDLFVSGDALGGNIYRYYRWYDDSYLGLTIIIDQIDESTATIEFRFN